MKLRVVVLGAGFGGLELTAILSEAIIAEFEHGVTPSPYNGTGICYVEFGNGKVGKVDVDFFSGSAPMGTHHEASEAFAVEKEHFGSSRKKRWFGVQGHSK